MKRYSFIIALMVLSLAVKAQQTGTLSLNLYGGYIFKDKVNFDVSHAYVDAGVQYGGGLEYFLQSRSSVEVKYLRMDTHIPYYLDNGTHVNVNKDKGSVQYILAGYTGYFGNSSGKAVPYAGIGLGAGIISIKEGNSTTKFAWDAKLGVKLKTSSAVSVNLQAYFQSITSAVGSDYWVYPGGAVVAVPGYVSLFQFGLGAVVSLNFGKGR